jgi:hypothetical protein
MSHQPADRDSLSPGGDSPQQPLSDGTAVPTEPTSENRPKWTPILRQWLITAINFIAASAMSFLVVLTGNQLQQHIRGQVHHSPRRVVILVVGFILCFVGYCVIIINLIFLRIRYESENHEAAFERAARERIQEYLDAWDRGVRDPRELGVEGYEVEHLIDGDQLQGGQQEAALEQGRRHAVRVMNEDRRRRVREAMELERRIDQAYMLFGGGGGSPVRSDRAS